MEDVILNERGNINGRDLRKPYGSATINSDGSITIRVDDEERPAWWLEVRLTHLQVDALLEEGRRMGVVS